MRTFAQQRRLGVFVDLAKEATELLRGQAQVELAGVEETVEDRGFAQLTRIKILNQQGAETLGRPCGTYLTLEIPGLHRDCSLTEPSGLLLGEILKEMLPTGPGTVLLVGLGNDGAAPDCLGPKVVARSLATRHLFIAAPEDVAEGFISVALHAPNVLGNTGLEAQETVAALVKAIEARLLLVVDSLASASLRRVGISFQLADTGIVPGSGIGNHRAALNRETLGIPVLALGVPTVVHAQTIINEALALMAEATGRPNQPELGAELTEKLLQDREAGYAVTPKDVDMIIETAAKVLTIGINLALHPGLDRENYSCYLNV